MVREPRHYHPFLYDVRYIKSRDADFIEQEKFASEKTKKDALRAERVRNFGILESEQAVINLQVKLGKGDLIKGGGSQGLKGVKSQRRK